MIKKKKPRKNYRKGQKPKPWLPLLDRIMLGIKITAAVAGFAATTGFFILIHEIVTQCDYFAAETITISGTRRLTHDQVARQARIRTGDNILSVNLSLVRKRLLAHPWIAEAGVSREIPSGLRIRIEEHSPLAVVDVGKKFLINHSGIIFKAWDASDPADLPVVNGLNVLEDRSHLTIFFNSLRSAT